MREYFRPASHIKKGFSALKPLLMIIIFMILAAALLIIMDALGSGKPPVDWGWIFYIGGAVALFGILAFRASKKDVLSEKENRNDPSEVQDEGDAECSDKLADIRRRIRSRKTHDHE